MGNKKKFKPREDATRIVSYKGEMDRTEYRVETYNGKQWKTIEGCECLTYPLAQIARRNYISCRTGVQIANKCVLRVKLPEDCPSADEPLDAGPCTYKTDEEDGD